MAGVQPRKRKFASTVQNPITKPATHTDENITPQPKLLSRDRLLKLAPSTEETRIALERNKQTCAFFKLPAEIRSRIYTLALGDLYIRIESRPYQHRIDWLNLNDGTECVVGGPWYYAQDLTSTATIDTDKDGILIEWSRRCKLTLPARTCRQMYADTVLLHLELNVFSFDNDWVLREWMLQLKPVQKRALRRLDLSRCLLPGKTLSKQLSGLRQIYLLSVWFDVCRDSGYILLDEVSEGQKEPQSSVDAHVLI